MADLVDKTAEKDFTEEAVRYALSKQHKVTLRGKCLNCDAPLPPTGLYCDEDCKYDYERRAAKC